MSLANNTPRSFSATITDTLKQNKVVIGGVELDEISQTIIKLQGMALATKYQTLFYAGAAYQVPVGKKLVLKAIAIISNTTSLCNINFGYGDTAVNNDVTGPTSRVEFMSAFGAYLLYGPVVVGQKVEVPLSDLVIPAGKYGFIQANGGTTNVSCTLIGVLLDV